MFYVLFYFLGVSSGFYDSYGMRKWSSIQGGGKTPLSVIQRLKLSKNIKCGAGVIYMGRKYNEIVMACNVNQIFIT